MDEENDKRAESPVTDLDIQALIDGELTEEEARFIFSVIETNPALQNRYLLYQRQKNILKQWFKDH